MKTQFLLWSFVTAVMVRAATAAPTDGFVEVPYFHYMDNPSNLMQSKWANIKVWRRAPKILSIVKTGTEVVIYGTRGTPETTCYVLASANVAARLTNWTRIATNFFDSRGGVSFTDTIDATTPQRVYRLELP